MLNELRLADASRFRMYVANVSHAHHPAVVERAPRTVRSCERWPAADCGMYGRPARLVQMIRQEEIDVVHTHLEGADVIGGAAGRVTGRPVVSTLHIVHEYRDNLRRGRRVLADFANRRLADRFIAVGDEVKESHVRRLGLDPSSIAVMPNVSIADRTLPPAFDPVAFRVTLGVPEGALLCTVANLIDNKKDVPTLIAALPLVRREFDQKFTLLIVGDGPQRSRLTALAAELGVADNIRFLGYRDDATQIMASSDMLCHATLFEGLPMVVLEAMTLGTVVIGTRSPGVTELVVDGQTGLLVPQRDPEAFATAIVRLLRSSSLQGELRAGATREMATHYDADEWIAGIEALYLTLAG